MIIKDLSLSAIESGIREYIDSVEDNRERERQRLISYFEHNSTEKFVRDYFKGTSLSQVPVFTQAFLRRAVTQRSLVYKKSPIIRADEKYINATKELNTYRRQFEQLTFLLGSNAMLSRPHKNWQQGKKELDYSIIPIFKPLFVDGNKDPIGISYPLYNYGQNSVGDQTYIVWTDPIDNAQGLHFMVKGGKSMPVPGNSSIFHPYDTMPISFAHRSPQIAGDFWVEGATDLAQANLHLDIALTELALAYRFDAVGIKWIKNLPDDQNSIESGVDKFIVLPTEADIGRLGSASLDQLINATKFFAEVHLQNNHLQVKWANTGQAKSGESLKIENIENLEQREASIDDTWRSWERKRFEIDKNILSKLGVQVDDFFSVDFKEPTMPMSQSETRDQWQWEFEQFGDERKRAYWIERDPEIEEETLEKYIQTGFSFG